MNAPKIEIGRRIRYHLPFNDVPHALIVAIHGTPGENLDRRAGVVTVVNPAGCTFDIVTTDGRRFHKVRESRIDKPGIGRVDLLDRVHGPELIAVLERQVIERQTAEAVKAADDKQQHADAVAQLILDNPTLEPAQRHAGGQQCARNLRKMLKAAGIKAKSLRSDYNSLTLRLPADASDAALDQARTLAHRFVGGHFDGMTDSYEYAKFHAWGDAFGSVKYAFVDRERGDA